LTDYKKSASISYLTSNNAFTQRIFFVTAITGLSYTLPCYYTALYPANVPIKIIHS